jgi:hypothetical protein
MSSPLQDSAMLVTLTISQWTARKFDRKVTKEVNTTHGAKDAGRFNKLLIAADALAPLGQIEGAARAHHYSVTLPWGNLGERLLPATLFKGYTDEMSTFEREFDKRVADLVRIYPQLVQDARAQLGGLYDPADYPQEIRSRFSFKINFTPVPSAADFRVNLNADFVEQIKADITRQQQSRQTEAVKHVWTRVREVVEKIQEVCSKEKPRIFDSMIENASQLISILPALNINGDPELDKIAEQMKALVVPVDSLRNSVTRRHAVKKSADQILASMPWA